MSTLYICLFILVLALPYTANAAHPVSSTDTLWIDSISTHSGQPAIIEINFINDQPLVGIDLPLKYVYPDMIIDSVSFVGGRAEERLTTLTILDPENAVLHIGALDLDRGNSPIPPGKGLLARLFFNVPREYPQRNIPIDTTFIKTELAFVLENNEWFTPNFKKGFIENSFAPDFNDSIWIDDADIEAGEDINVSIYYFNEFPVKNIIIPLSFDSDNLILDSISTHGTRSDITTEVDTIIDNIEKTAIITFGFSNDQMLTTGEGTLANLYFSSDIAGTSGHILIDTIFNTNYEIECRLGENHNSQKFYPYFSPGAITIDLMTGIDDSKDTQLPDILYLGQNHPNPFNPVTDLSFSLPRQSEVKLDVFNILGQKVRSLFSGTLPAGAHSFVFDGHDDKNKVLASGVYLYQLTAGIEKLSRKMVLLK